MGTYATTTSFSQLIPFIFKGNSTGSDPDTVSIVSKHINRAESMVNSYLTGRYSLPFTTVPPELIRLTEDIASFNILRGSFAVDGQLRDSYQDDFKSAKEELQMIRDGQTMLALTNGSIVSTNAESRIISSTEDYKQIFDLDDAKNWDVDEDQAEDIATSRG